MENNKVKEELVITDWQHNFSLEMTTLSRVVSNMLPQGENNLSLENIFLMMMPLVQWTFFDPTTLQKKTFSRPNWSTNCILYIRAIFTRCNFLPSTIAKVSPSVQFAQTQLCLKRDNMRHCRNWPSDFSWPADNEGERGENKYTVVVPISLHHLQQNLGVLNYYLQLLRVHVYTENMLMS